MLKSLWWSLLTLSCIPAFGYLSNPDVTINTWERRSGGITLDIEADNDEIDGFLIEFKSDVRNDQDNPGERCPNGMDVPVDDHNRDQRRIKQRVFYIGLQANTKYTVRVCSYNKKRGRIRDGLGKGRTDINTGSPRFFITAESHTELPNNPDPWTSNIDPNNVTLTWRMSPENQRRHGVERFLVALREGKYPPNNCLNGVVVDVNVNEVSDYKASVTLNRLGIRRLRPETYYGARICPISRDGNAGAGSIAMFLTDPVEIKWDRNRD